MSSHEHKCAKCGEKMVPLLVAEVCANECDLQDDEGPTEKTLPEQLDLFSYFGS